MTCSSISGIPDLWRETYGLVSQVPHGRVTTYGQVARALGDVVASRFVGLAMTMSDDTEGVPCRRVVQSDGRLGGYTGGGPRKKAALLKKEGVHIEHGKVVELDRFLFKDFVSSFPLAELRSRQRRLRRLVDVPETAIDVRNVAGIDVAYRGEHGFAAAAVFDYESGEVVSEIVREGDAMFPYVPTYLAFRELPIVSSLMDELPADTVLMYDGNGLLHPEGMGIATHAGVAFSHPTVGIAKSLLCGSRSAPRADGTVPILVGDAVAGYELTGPGSTRPIYASVGNGIGLEQALDVVRRFLKHRVPEPTRIAHILAEKARETKPQIAAPRS